MDLKKICKEAIIQDIREKVEKIDKIFDEEIVDDEDFKQDIYALMTISTDAFMQAKTQIGEEWGRETEERPWNGELIDKFECIIRTYTCYVLYTFIAKNRDKIIKMTEDKSLSFEDIGKFLAMGIPLKKRP